VSNFRLDKYEVTVGRFRRFVDAAVGGWRPAGSAGKHSHLNGGNGLAAVGGGFEPGWDTAWNQANTTYRIYSSRADWNSSLACDANYQTWTSSSGTNETRPINCVNWYQAYAFCIWDGGFLPSEAEHKYAIMGGNEQRDYPWGSTAPSSNANLAVWGCYYDGTGTCTGVTNIAPVGSVAAGNGRFGQADLAGNVEEWDLDWWRNPLATPCNNCANFQSGPTRMAQSDSFNSSVGLSSSRTGRIPESRTLASGIRCARSP